VHAFDAFEWRNDPTFAVVIEVPGSAKADQLTTFERSDVANPPALAARSHRIVHARPFRVLQFLHRQRGRRDAESAAHQVALPEIQGITSDRRTA